MEEKETRLPPEMPFSIPFILYRKQNAVVIGEEIVLFTRGTYHRGKRIVRLVFQSESNRTLLIRNKRGELRDLNPNFSSGNWFLHQVLLRDGESLLIDSEYEIFYSRRHDVRDGARRLMAHSTHSVSVRSVKLDPLVRENMIGELERSFIKGA